MIYLTNATVRYQTKLLPLPDIRLAQGGILGLNGVSGSGKSTVAMLLSGFLIPTSGIVVTPAYDKHKANPVQWVGQHPELSFNPKWTLLKSLKESFRQVDFDSHLKSFSIEKEWLSRYPKELSGGQLQRIALLRALLPTTQYLLCDEITAQLDPITQQSIWTQLLKLSKEKNIGLLIISHEKSLLNSICEKVITLK
ncbi:ATP-binding cassette domain-containing protein [Aliivibrio finisterrensis]|uniref:ATP-binding cassette domain-containing protein n=1 Tax=Aliivibrio finisterrensis TaxID=511998 RepID=UPI0010218164|nr:ATP-binding cassette domain-containing protein [Aliivibrio finisterrensis]RYU68436.1 ATP-binding cassette domain-containing protein [Aliivibrio finisterrensis]RYU72189.1 ATP-binding cassette domain-containing protein [Aliivibrio finisterrensis]RYU75705.1 ATP-binding cassette domain-containing protein [Aliivibrio finisterrensis]